jgi:hypothetical protein
LGDQLITSRVQKVWILKKLRQADKVQNAHFDEYSREKGATRTGVESLDWRSGTGYHASKNSTASPKLQITEAQKFEAGLIKASIQELKRVTTSKAQDSKSGLSAFPNALSTKHAGSKANSTSRP